MGKFTLKDKLNKLQELSKDSRISNIFYSELLLDEDCPKVFGNVLNFDLKDNKNYPRYAITVEATDSDMFKVRIYDKFDCRYLTDGCDDYLIESPFSLEINVLVELLYKIKEKRKAIK